MNSVASNEIITIGVGQCGIYMLNEFLSTIMDEHKLDHNGQFTGNWADKNDQLLMLKHSAYFTETKHNQQQYIPRSLFMDLDRTSIDAVHSSLGHLLPHNHFCGKSCGTDPLAIWPRGIYTDGAEAMDEYMNALRSCIERCDVFEGFQIFHSVAGGCGGGFGSSLLMQCRDNYSDRYCMSYTLYPSLNSGHHSVRNKVLEVYNSILSVHNLIENGDLCFGFDNSVLSGMALEQYGLQHANYAHLNSMLAQVVSGTTATLRFHCEPAINTCMSEYGHSLCPFPRLKFVTTTHAPFVWNSSVKTNTNVSDIIRGVFWDNDCLGVDIASNKIVTTTVVYRGNDENAIAELEKTILTAHERYQKQFVSWMPRMNVQSAVVTDTSLAYRKYDETAPFIATAITSSCGVKHIFSKLQKAFSLFYKRRAFFHWYRNEGMDEMEFQEAMKNVRDLWQDYQLERTEHHIDYGGIDDGDDDDDAEEEEEEEESE